jgi:hypothetical protein
MSKERNMKSICVGAGTVALFLALAPGVAAQGGGAPGGTHVSIPRVPIESHAVKGAPYFAEVATESVQVLADGNRIARKTTGRVYRDSQGRIRREEDREPGRVRSVSITDPIGGFAWALDPETKVAWKTPYRAAGLVAHKLTEMSADPLEVERRRDIEKKILEAEHALRTKEAADAGAVPAAEIHVLRNLPYEQTVEKLPARQIEGVMAQGTRTTRTIPAGAIGNEQPIAIVTEQWRSPELNILVLTRTSDPRAGETTYRLAGITRGEPDASWFAVPADYTVRETGISREMPHQ